MSRYQEYLRRQRAKHGKTFNPAQLDQRFVPYMDSEERIRVETCGMVLTGTVGVTTGWLPVFLLMRRKNDSGSPWTLGPTDRILAVKRGRKYVAVNS